MSDLGWCPFAKQHRSAAGPFGYPAETRGQNKPVLFIDHRMGGYKRTLDSDAWRHGNDVGVHAGIGRDGSIDQYTNIFDASWGNGVAGSLAKYDRHNPRLVQLEGLGVWRTVRYAGATAYALIDTAGVNVINAHTISTEHEDEGRDQPWPEAMVEATIRWKQWCLDECASVGIEIERDEFMLAGHRQIDGVNRSECPGSHWPRERILEALMGPTKEEFTSLFKYVIETNKAYGAAIYDLAKQVYGDGDPKTADLKQRIDALEAARDT